VQARRRLLRLRRASGCLGTSCGSSRGSSSTTSTTPRIRVPRHVARLITRLVVPLVVDYFTYAACQDASAYRAACYGARRRLLQLRRVFGCLSTSRGSSRNSSHRSSSTTSPTLRVRVPRHVARLVAQLVVDYFTYAVHSVASARHAACLVTHCQLLRLAQAHRQLLHLLRASGCLGTSRGSSWKTLTSPLIQVPRRVARC
jgi:hypothetical protein